MDSEPQPQQEEAAGQYVEVVIQVAELLLAALEWGRRVGDIPYVGGSRSINSVLYSLEEQDLDANM